MKPKAAGNAFKALSAEALQNNNQAFLELARRPGKISGRSRGDLDKRQQAINQLVEPCSNHCKKLTGK